MGHRLGDAEMERDRKPSGGGWRLLVAVTLIASITLAACGTAAGQAGGIPDDYPDKAIELVVPYAPGGGSDNMARTITAILQREGIFTKTINVVNREGGSGTVGQTYVAGKKGDNYTIMTMTSGIITNEFVLDTDITYRDFTPIARLALDQLLIIVRADSPFQTIEDLINAAKETPDGVSWGGTGLGGEDSLLLAQIEKEADVQLNYISFDSGGEVQAALLGGHIDVASANPNEVLGQIEAGEIRALAVAGPERLGQLPDVPTLKEKGINAIYEQTRGILGPPDMDPAAVEFWAEIFRQLSESEAWQAEFIEANMLRSGYLGPEDYRKAMDEESATVKELIEEMGLGSN